MIEFYKDNLVPSELCRMLYEAVPKEYHVPVRFHNRRREHLYGNRGFTRRAACAFRVTKSPRP